MATILTPTKTWVAREGELYIDKYPLTKVATNLTLSGAFVSSGNEISAAITNITITPPETAWDKVDLIGKDTNQFQNQLLDEKPVGIATLQVTAVVAGDETFETYLISGTTATAPAGYTRFQIGKSQSSDNQLIVAAHMLNTTAGKELAVAMEAARVTKWGDVRQTADGHMEQDVTFVCLAKNFYYEFKN